MQNLVVFMSESLNEYYNLKKVYDDDEKECWDISLKDGNKFLNRFSIDEDAAFELSGVRYLKRSEKNTIACRSFWERKGKGNLR